MTTPLDIEQPPALLAYLRAQNRIALDETPLIEILPGGVSNRTVRVTRPSGEAWVLKQALAKLRVAVDWFSSPERIHREALGLRWLNVLVPGCVPAFVFEDHDAHILAMQAVPAPHANWKSLLLQGQLERDHVIQFAQLLAAIHARSAARHAELALLFADRSFFETLRIEPYYAYTAEQIPASAAFYAELISKTRAQQIALVHGDYSPKNILVQGNRLILLDHEVIHFGDPAFDVGFALTHLLSKADHLSLHRDAFLQAAHDFWNQYRAVIDAVAETALGNPIDFEARVALHTLGCLLARVAGRSPLEYLSHSEKVRQHLAVLRLMKKPPATVAGLITEFGGGCSEPGNDQA